MASPRRSSVVHRGAFRLAAILLVSSSPKKVRAFVPAAGGGIASCSRQQQQQHMKQRDAWSAGVVDVIPCAATKTWGSREGGSGAVPTAGRVRRWDAQLAATPEGVEASSSNEGAVGEGGERSSDGSSASSSAEEDAVWARAQLPMSNDMQVEQATRAVWQVNTLLAILLKRIYFLALAGGEYGIIHTLHTGTCGIFSTYCCTDRRYPIPPRPSPSRNASQRRRSGSIGRQESPGFEIIAPPDRRHRDG